MRVEGRDGGELNEGSKVPSQLRLGMESTFGAPEHSQANQLAMPLMRSAALLFRSTTRPRHLGWGPDIGFRVSGELLFSPIGVHTSGLGGRWFKISFAQAALFSD